MLRFDLVILYRNEDKKNLNFGNVGNDQVIDKDLDWLEEDYLNTDKQDMDQEEAKLIEKMELKKEEGKEEVDEEEVLEDSSVAKKVNETLQKSKADENSEKQKEETTMDEVEDGKEENKNEGREAEGEGEEIYDKEDKISDLDIYDIDDDDVSEVNLDELLDIEEDVKDRLSKEMIMRMKIAEESRSKNKDFIKNLCDRYKQKPEAAKAYYYREKVQFDVEIQKGKDQRDEMLREYLIGMQWVLFYYYKGVQHWGYYYKYHYPPMISDLKNIESLLGTSTITSFDHIESVNKPFYPFQQLLTILPPDSIRNLLPKCYSDDFIENPMFKKFYPLTFDQDLNGRSMPWESIVLIPFIDEKLLIDHERKLEAEGKLIMNEKDVFRNKRGIEKWYEKIKSLENFEKPEPQFNGFDFGRNNKCKVTEMPPVDDDFVGTNFIFHENTDTTVVCDFPSLNNLTIDKMTLKDSVIRGTRFQIPQIYIDGSLVKELDLKAIALSVINREAESIFIDYPFLHEAFIYSIVTVTKFYNVYECWARGSPKNMITDTTRDEWNEAVSFVNRTYRDKNVVCTKQDVIIGFNRVSKLKWNMMSNTFEKDYKPEVEYIPIQMV